jgi:hypothetical protein
MSSASSGLAATGVGSAHLTGENSGRMYSERMVARPSEPVSCGSPAGIHRARVGGSTQVAS